MGKAKLTESIVRDCINIEIKESIHEQTTIIKSKYFFKQLMSLTFCYSIDGNFGKLVDAKELYVGWLKKMKIVNLDSNRIVNFASNSMNGSICGRLMVDSNTVPENMLDLKGNDIKEYVAACILQAKGDFNVFVE